MMPSATGDVATPPHGHQGRGGAGSQGGCREGDGVCACEDSERRMRETSGPPGVEGGGEAAPRATGGSLVDALPLPALAALTSHLSAPDLLRFGLSSRAAAAALAEIPRLHEGAATAALGWPRARKNRTPGEGGDAGENPSSSVEQQQQQQQQQQQRRRRPLGTAAGRDARPCAALGSAPAAVGPGGPHQSDAAYRQLLSAACALAAAAAPHCLRPCANAPGRHAAAALGKAAGFVAADPSALSPPLELTAEQQRALTLGGPGVHCASLGSCPRSQRSCRCGVAVEVGGRVEAELFLGVHHQQARPPPAGWGRLMSGTPAARVAEGRGGGGCGAGCREGGGGCARGCDGGECCMCEASGPPGMEGGGEAAPFELYLSGGVAAAHFSAHGAAASLAPGRAASPQTGQPGAPSWPEVRAAVLSAASRNAARSATARLVAVLHPCSTGRALLAAGRALAALEGLGYPVLDLRSPSGVPAASVDDGGGGGGGCGPCASWPPGGPAHDAARRWRLARAMVREEALGNAWSGGDGAGGVGMARAQAAAAAVTQALQALPNVAPDVRVLVVPVVLPPGGRVGHPEPGRPPHRGVSAPHFLSLNTPVLTSVRTAAAQLPRLQQVLVVCPDAGGRGGAAPLMYGVTRALAMSCIDR